MTRDISREACPERLGISHHMRPKKQGRGVVMVCQYCGQTATQIRASAPTEEIDLTYTTTGREGPSKWFNFNRKRG